MLAFVFNAHNAESESVTKIKKVDDATHFNLVNAFTSPYEIVDQPKLDQISSYVNNRAKSLRFNGEILIAKNNQIIYQDAFGYKDPIKKTDLTPGHSFELASVSKQFTAAAILKLQEEKSYLFMIL